jgi:hypothetical protein
MMMMMSLFCLLLILEFPLIMYRNRGKAPVHETDQASKKRKEGPQSRRGGSSSQGGGSDHPHRFVDRERAERFQVIDDWKFIAV